MRVALVDPRERAEQLERAEHGPRGRLGPTRSPAAPGHELRHPQVEQAGHGGQQAWPDGQLAPEALDDRVLLIS